MSLFTECFQELVSDLQNVDALPKDVNFVTPTAKSFLQFITPFEKEITNKADTFLVKYPYASVDNRVFFITLEALSNNGTISLSEYKTRIDTIFKYFENLFVYAHIDDDEINSPALAKKNLSSYRGNKQQNLLKDMIRKVESAIKPKLDNEKAKSLLQEISHHTQDPMQILNVLQNADLNIMGVVQEITDDIKKKVENKELSEDELHNCLNEMMMMNSNILNNLQLQPK